MNWSVECPSKAAMGCRRRSISINDISTMCNAPKMPRRRTRRGSAPVVAYTPPAKGNIVRLPVDCPEFKLGARVADGTFGAVYSATFEGNLVAAKQVPDLAIAFRCVRFLLLN
jgi:hypothetical protein